MSLPFARLATSGETPNKWPSHMIKEIKRLRPPKKHPSMTPKAIYIRAYRAGTYTYMSKEAVHTIRSAAAKKRCANGGHCNFRPKPR